MKRLYIFTANFPYGYAESFLETEIDYLAKKFTQIYIIPFTGEISAIRLVPDNCVVLNPISENRLLRYLRGLFGWKALPLFVKDFFKQKVYANNNKLKTWFIGYVNTNNYLHSKVLSKLLSKVSESDIVYFYWGKGGNSLAPYLYGKTKLLSRFHGEWDLWEESSANYFPIRESIAKSLDKAIFISNKGELYFKLRYPFCKTEVSRLGTIDKGIVERSEDGVIRILSCSSVIPLKRVQLIYDSLQYIDNRVVEWTHIGDGSEFNELCKRVKNSKSNIKVKLLGRMQNCEVLDYYVNNKVDMFINVSTTEGVPVSIMEAISFNIPIIATNVGGTSEIVTEETGILLSPNPSCQDIAFAVLSLYEMELSPRKVWLKNYSADKNYSSFAETLLSI